MRFRKFLCAAILSVATVVLQLNGGVALADDWPTSLHDTGRTASSTDTGISVANAPNLVRAWTYHTGGPVASTPTVTGGVAYFGSWDGYEYAVDAVTGALKWRMNLGITHGADYCIPPVLGVSSPATVAGGVVYVGGGDAYWYALDAATGAVLWRVYTGDNSAAGGAYNWSGPLVVGGYAYIGVASLGDCPLVQGKLIKVSLTTHAVVNTLNLVPNGSVGGGIWTSPAYDAATNLIYTATGTENSPTQQDAQAFLAIDAGTLQIKDSWKLPESEAVLDSDFSTSTTLFSDSAGRKLITSINKNGYAYTFDRTQLSDGPIWRQYIAEGGECPTCGESSVSSGTFGQGTLYLAGATGTIGDTAYPGTVRAINPATGAYLWSHATSGTVIGALAYANGVVYSAGGSVFEALDASTGRRLYSYDTGAQIFAGASVANGMTYVGNTNGDVVAFKVGTPVTPPADPNCPTGFTCADVGSPTPAGSESVSGGVLTLNAGGAGLTGTADAFRVAAKPAGGDVQVSARLSGLTGGTSAAGVIVRQSLDPASPYYAVLAKPGNTLVVQQRSQQGGPTSTLVTVTRPAFPLYLAVRRVGDSVQAATSTDGTTYGLVPGTNASVPMPDTSYAGVAATSGAQGSSATATLSMITLAAPTGTLTPPPPATPCPSGWSCQDIGNPNLAGDQSLSGSTWTLKGAGGDIWGTADQFHYVWQTIAADGTVSARVASQSNTDPNAKAGVMIRSGTAAGSAYYAAYVTPSGGIQVQSRESNGVAAQQITNPSGTAPVYLRVARSGQIFTAYTSTNGTSWTPVAASSRALPDLAGTVLAGLAVTAHNSTAVSTVTADHVVVGTSADPPPNLCPTGWSCADIGFPTPVGSQTLTAGTWAVQGGGGDVWGTTDQLRLVAEPQTGDGGISARVTSQQNTSEWAKSGVMIRESNLAIDPYYAVFVTPAHGVVVQYRKLRSGATSQVSIAGTAPVYVRAGRVGEVFTGYTSSNGTTWTAIPGSAVTMSNLTGTLLAGLAVCGHNTVDINTTVFDNVTVTGAGTGGSGLPAPWAQADLGGATPAGSSTFDDNVFSVRGGGNDIWGSTDQGHYVYQPLHGDGTIVARVPAQQNTSDWAKSGVMIKDSTTAGSPYALMAVTPANGYQFQYGYNTGMSGGTPVVPDAWVRLTRTGNVFTAYRSRDGGNWFKVGQATISMAHDATVGLVVSSHDGAALNTTSFDNVIVTADGGAPVPSPWTSADVGGPLVPGSASYLDGTFSVHGSGSDIWGTADQFQYVSQPLNGDGTITVRVTDQDNTDPWAKSGIMVKQSATAGSPYAAVMVTPGNDTHMQAGFSTEVAATTYRFPDAWLRLKRTGNVFTGYTSPDGVTWTLLGTTTVAVSATATVGMFVSSHNPGVLNTTTFDNVSVTATGGALPAGWTDTDVGGPAQPGGAGYAGGVFTVTGGGNDIWGTVDQFHYASRTLTGNATITARVTGQTNTSDWAKSGVMIKQSTTGGSTYAMLAVTPGNGLHFQYAFNGDVSGAAGGPPVWLRLVRTGTTVTAYRSAAGTTWTTVGSTALTTTDPVTIGLFVCSHNGGQLNQTTFDNVAVT